jgi:hypothetical protein
MASARAPPSREAADDDDDDAQANAAHGITTASASAGACAAATAASVDDDAGSSSAPAACTTAAADATAAATETACGTTAAATAAATTAAAKGPPVVAALALPVLPADVLRAIWQAKWRAEAACVVQQAWRAGADRRSRRRTIKYLCTLPDAFQPFLVLLRADADQSDAPFPARCTDKYMYKGMDRAVSRAGVSGRTGNEVSEYIASVSVPREQQRDEQRDAMLAAVHRSGTPSFFVTVTVP